MKHWIIASLLFFVSSRPAGDPSEPDWLVRNCKLYGSPYFQSADVTSCGDLVCPWAFR